MLVDNIYIVWSVCILINERVILARLFPCSRFILEKPPKPAPQLFLHYCWMWQHNTRKAEKKRHSVYSFFFKGIHLIVLLPGF